MMSRGAAAAALLAGLAALAGCSAMGPASTLPEAQCHAARAAAFLDKPASETNLNEAMVHAGAVRRQVAPYGAPAAGTDVDPQRLNIEVDANRVIRKLRCG